MASHLSQTLIYHDTGSLIALVFSSMEVKMKIYFPIWNVCMFKKRLECLQLFWSKICIMILCKSTKYLFSQILEYHDKFYKIQGEKWK